MFVANKFVSLVVGMIVGARFLTLYFGLEAFSQGERFVLFKMRQPAPMVDTDDFSFDGTVLVVVVCVPCVVMVHNPHLVADTNCGFGFFQVGHVVLQSFWAAT